MAVQIYTYTIYSYVIVVLLLKRRQPGTRGEAVPAITGRAERSRKWGNVRGGFVAASRYDTITPTRSRSACSRRGAFDTSIIIADLA